jgi:hypothetical protein
VVWLDCMVVLFLIFWGNSIFLSIAVALIFIPTNSVEMFPFSHILTSICCLWIDGSHFDWGEVESQFWFAFPLWVRMLSISSYIYWSFVFILFENCLFSSFAYLFSGLLILGGVSFLTPCIFWVLIPRQMYCWQRFSPIL